MAVSRILLPPKSLVVFSGKSDIEEVSFGCQSFRGFLFVCQTLDQLTTNWQIWVNYP